MKYGGTESKPQMNQDGRAEGRSQKKGPWWGGCGWLRGWGVAMEHPVSPFSVTDDVIMTTQFRTESIKNLSTTNHCYVSVKLSRLWLNKVIKAQKSKNNNNNSNNNTRRMTSALTRLPEHISWRREHSSAVSIVPFLFQRQIQRGEKNHEVPIPW